MARIRTVAVFACALAVALVTQALLASPVRAEDASAKKADAEKPYVLDVSGSLKMQPDRSGVLTVRMPVGKYKVESQYFSWKPMPVDGVTYDKAKAKVTPTEKWSTKWQPELIGWKHDFEVRVPLQVAPSVKAGTLVGITLSYIACDTDGCGLATPLEVVAPVPAKDAAKGPTKGPTIVQPTSHEEGGATARLSDDGKAVIVTFDPGFGWHFYLPGQEFPAITIEPKPAPGVTWGEVKIPTGDKITSSLDVRVPFTRDEDTANALEIAVTWSGCSTDGLCNPERSGAVRIAWASSGIPAIVRPPTKKAKPRGEVAFEVIDTDDLGDDLDKDQGDISKLVREKGLLLALGILFAIGAGLAFTPCVFPIIPLVVATITGGKEVPKRRLTALLGTYVLGLCLAFASLGLVAALGGVSMSAAFESAAFQWGFSILFILLAFGMLGLFELQPPQWLMRMQGGAQEKAGSMLGAFLLGVLGAVLASPCTGPVIVGLVLFTAKSGDMLLGFTMFFTLGLGMGAIFFAFGSLNFALRPGPWMVWVRYVFGMLLFGGAMYYVGSGRLARGWSVAIAAACFVAFAILAIKAKKADHFGEKKRVRKWLLLFCAACALVALLWFSGFVPDRLVDGPIDLVLAGVLIAAASAFGLFWHLYGKEGESKGVASKRAMTVGAMYLVVLALVAFITWPPPEKIAWKYVWSRAELVAAIEQASAEGKPALVDIWAET